MKKIVGLMVCSLCMFVAYSQKVGIGTNMPEMALHAESADSATLLISNSTTMDENTSTGLYLKNGFAYTGALRTIGTGVNVARLGLFTYASSDMGQLKERLSISDGGFVGINNTTPSANLHVVGSQKIQYQGSLATPALDISSTLVGTTAAGINVQTAGSGIITGTTNILGTGLMAWNGQYPLLQAGTAITAHSTNGNGIYAMSIKNNGFSILANSALQSVTAGRFQNSGGGKALVTSGMVQIEGQGAGTGKVLTSDATGNASWQEQGTKVGFRGFLPFDITLSPGSIVPISGITAITNDGNGLNSNAGEFTAPSEGWYQFTTNVQFTLPSANMRMAVDLYRNDFLNTGMTVQFAIAAFTGGGSDSRTATQLVKLAAGEKVRFQFRHIGGTGTITMAWGVSSTTTMFNGVKM